jgi:hypothetical protein
MSYTIAIGGIILAIAEVVTHECNNVLCIQIRSLGALFIVLYSFAAATVASVASFLLTPSPRTLARKIEIAVFLIPLIYFLSLAVQAGIWPNIAFNPDGFAAG